MNDRNCFGGLKSCHDEQSSIKIFEVYGLKFSQTGFPLTNSVQCFSILSFSSNSNPLHSSK